MLHDMKLYEENFDRVASGVKLREYRLYDEKRRQIKVGDTIRFIRLPDKERCCYADVVKIEVFKNWYDCYQKYFDEDFKGRYATIQDVVDDTYNGYYTEEETKENGCCCITLAKVRKVR